MPPSRRAELGAVWFAMVFPTLVTIGYFGVFVDQDPRLLYGSYLVGKGIQFAFPCLWVFLVCREKLRFPIRSLRGLPTGAAFGLAVAVAMIALYHLVFKPAGIFENASEVIIAKITSMRLDSWYGYLALSLFYPLIHSLMEEYYWRWFVFGRLRLHYPLWPAILVSNCGFMAHHVFLLATFFGWLSPFSYLFSLSVAVGGAVWSWLYARSGSLLGPWASHALIDAAIFIVGADIVWNQLT